MPIDPRLQGNGDRPVEKMELLQPVARVTSGGGTFLPTDIGNFVFETGAGAAPWVLPDLSANLVAGRSLLFTVQCTGDLAHAQVTPAANVQINNAGLGVAFDAGVGRTRISLLSKDGLNYFTGV